MKFLKSILKFIHTIFIFLFLILAIVFMVNNRDIMIIHLYPLPFEIETRAFIVMISCFILGLVFAVLIFSKTLIKNLFYKFSTNKKIKSLQDKINNDV